MMTTRTSMDSVDTKEEMTKSTDTRTSMVAKGKDAVTEEKNTKARDALDLSTRVEMKTTRKVDTKDKKEVNARRKATVSKTNRNLGFHCTI